MEWVLDSLPRLHKMAETDTWWEVQAQIIILMTALMDMIDDWGDGGGQEAVNTLLDTLFCVFRPSSSINVRKVGLSSLSRFTAFNGRLRQQYLKVSAPFLCLLGLK